MNNKIETYLQTIEQELGSLKTEQRENELREMQQHIEAIVTRLIEGGLNENEAMEAAIAQFGEARQVGRELNNASTERDSMWRVLAATAIATGCFTLLMYVYPIRTIGSVDIHLPIRLSAQFYAFHELAAWIFALIAGSLAGNVTRSWFGHLFSSLCVAVLALAYFKYGGKQIVCYSFCPSYFAFALVGTKLGMRWPLPFVVKFERRKPIRT